MNQTQELERRLHETLRAKARQIDPADETHAALLPWAELVGATKRSRRGLAAIATALTVAAAATGVAVVTRSHGRSPMIATRSSSPTVAPRSGPNPIAAPLLAPSWVPDGEQLWSLTASTRADMGFVSQLFGTVAADGKLDPGLLVESQPASPGDGVGDGTAVTVRGKAGVTRPSKDAGVDTFEIDWIEGDAMVRVTVRGASVDEAVAALDALRPRGSSIMSGYDAASAPGGFPLLGDHLAASSANNVSATFEYAVVAPTAGAQPDFVVRSDVNGEYPGYLRIVMAGRRAADGVAIELDPGVGLLVAWPDGRSVVVQSTAAAPDVAELERIARSVGLLDEGHAASLAAGAQARVASLPLVGSASLPSGETELRGTGSPTAVCLRVDGFDPACSGPYTMPTDAGASNGSSPNTTVPGGVGGTLPGYGGSAVIGGRWYVFVAASAPPSFTTNGSPQSALATETGQIGDMHVALVAVPDDVDFVQVLVPTGPNQSAGTGYSRPG